MGGCLADDTIAALVEGRLTAAERALVHAHIDRCDACRSLIAEVVRGETLAADAPLAPGAIAGRYVVIGVIGAGAMGVVYDAWDPQLRRRVALKLLRPDRVAGPDGAPRLLREAQAMARLQHPNVVAVHDVGELGERVFVAMELVDGDTLAGWLVARRSWREIVAMFVQVGEGLAAAHAVGLVHRDFKPDNVLVGDGRARVTDFGLANASSVVTPAAGPVGSLTETGALLGTPAYMAPEQMAGGGADARSDEFAFCLALYEALYGERPFAGADLTSLRAAIERGDVVKPSRSDVPARVRRIVLRGLAGDPSARYASMRELLDQLSRVRRTRRLPVAIAAIAALAIVAPLSFAHHASSPCGGENAAWGDAWGDSSRAAVQAAFARTGRPSAALAATQVDRELSAYRDTWIATSTRVCEATHAEPLIVARAQCLDDRRREAASLGRVFAAADGALVDNVSRALHGLEPIEGCATVHANELAAPEDPFRAAALRERLAEIKALGLAGRYAQAFSLVRPAIVDAHALDDGSLEARLLYERGRLEKRTSTGDPEATLHASALAAIAAHDDGAAADAWTYLSYLAGFDGGRRTEGERWSSYAEAAIARLGGDDVREARRLQYLFGLVNGDMRRTDEATALLERSRAAVMRAGSPSALAIQNDQLQAALDLEIGRYADGYAHFRHVREVSERELGPDNPNLVTALLNEAVSLVLVGRAGEAVPIYKRVLALDDRAGPEGHATAYACFGLARAHRALGDFTAALDEDRRAVAIYDREHPAARWISDALTGEGEDLLGLGRAKDAVAPLERALAIRSAADADPDDRATTAFDLARALWDGGDRARAVQLATGARDEVAPLAARFGSSFADRLAAVTTWLASRAAPGTTTAG
ncbi:MAG TPA: protein kinase [Kofleriaceae bacterium]|jgi:tetratricopeptide (TPR) repeat protein